MSTSVTRRGTALLVAATISLLAALATASQAGAATYYACVKKNGSAHIYLKKPKCKKGESKLSWNNVAPAGKNGANGANGPNGKEGAQGPIGPQGPGATTFTFDAPASTTPPLVPLGTALGATVSAECFMPSAGQAALRVLLQTSDGSWGVDYTDITNSKGTSETYTNHLTFPAGTLTSPLLVDSLSAGVAPAVSDRQFDFIQLAPAKGHMIWHERVETTTAPAQGCHLSVQSFPSS